jgi:two-component system chemotaxis sensor kinase CheA
VKPYPAELFDVWAGDVGPVELAATSPFAAAFSELRDEAVRELDAIVAGARGLPLDADGFDRLYRRGHVIAGLAAVANLPKAAHLLALLDTALDLARTLRTFRRQSLDYVVHLLADNVRTVLADLDRGGQCALDLTDLVNECASYLRGALAEGAAPPPPLEARADEPPAPPGPAGHPAAEAATGAAAPPTIDGDGPEELEIPGDKVGLISDFCEESRENLERIGQRLIELEVAPEPASIVNDLFRAVHTIKGGARMLRLRKVEALAHELETSLDQVRRRSRGVTPELVDLLLEGRSALGQMVSEVASRGPIRTRIGPLLASLAASAAGDGPRAAVPAPAGATPTEPSLPAPPGEPAPVATGLAAAGAPETIRIATEKLDDVLNTASEIFINRIRLKGELGVMDTAIRDLKKAVEHVGRIDARAIERSVHESVRALEAELRALAASRRSPSRTATVLDQFTRRLASLLTSPAGAQDTTLHVLSVEDIRNRLLKTVEHLDQLSSRLQQGAMSFRMVPISALFGRFPTQVRSIARPLGKSVRLEVSGEDTQLDKVLINHLADPFLHLLRNAVDHGIEPPDERRARGKAEAGLIRLRAFYQGSHVVVEVEDDGRGIDSERVLARAIERGLVDAPRAASLPPSEVLAFIFEPGFSTVARVSELSGRGVGMDVVRTAVNEVQGSIALDTRPGQGTRVTIRLPLTLAVIRIVLVEEGGHRFALPLLNVDEILTVQRRDFTRLAAETVYRHRGRTLAVTTLSRTLGFPSSPFAGQQLFLVVLSEGDREVGVLVDAIAGRQEVLIKSLGRVIKKLRFAMGCTILSDSRLVLILNPREIVAASSAARRGGGDALAEETAAHRARRGHTVLVVDDSPIQQTDLRTILSRAGYAVDIAPNGFEALKRVRQKRYSAFLVDVFMPLMDGLEFVERLRRVPDSAPVFFVTGHRDALDVARGEGLGVQGWFDKPVAPDLLVAALDSRCLADGEPARA